MISQIKQNIDFATLKTLNSLIFEFTNVQIKNLTKLFNDLLNVRFDSLQLFSQQILQLFIETSNQTFFFIFSVEIVKFIRQLRLEKVDYFDSKYQKKSKKNNISILIVNIKKHVFYKNVFVFIERFKNLVKQHDNKIVERVLIFCLRDIALM